MKIRGKAWCQNCQQDQPATLVGLSINGAEKVITGFCSICEHPVQRTLTIETPKDTRPQPTEEDNCIPLHPTLSRSSVPLEEPKTIEQTSEVERPSLLTFVALFSVCLVITYLL